MRVHYIFLNSVIKNNKRNKLNKRKKRTNISCITYITNITTRKNISYITQNNKTVHKYNQKVQIETMEHKKQNYKQIS